MNPSDVPALLLAFVLGLLVGSFLNVCIHRWPSYQSVIRPRSRCPQCEAPITWYDNIPLLSYALLRGRCRSCGTGISLRYPVVELLNGLLYAYLFWRFGMDPVVAKMALFGSMMLILIFTDLTEYILPDEITVGGLVLGIALSPFVPHAAGPVRFFLTVAGTEWAPSMVSVAESVAAAVIVGGFLFLLGEAYYRFRHREGLGFGDVKMMAMVGAFWGLGYAVLTLIIGSITGSLVGIAIVLIGGKKWTYELPFGTYLGVAAIVVMLWRADMLSLYWQTVLPPTR